MSTYYRKKSPRLELCPECSVSFTAPPRRDVKVLAGKMHKVCPNGHATSVDALNTAHRKSKKG